MANPTASKELKSFNVSLTLGDQDKNIADLKKNFPQEAKTAINRARIFNETERQAVLECLAQAMNAINYFTCIDEKLKKT